MNQKVACITGTGMDSKTMAHFLIAKDYKVILTYRRNANLELDKIAGLFTNDLLSHPNAKLYFKFMDITDQSSIRFCIKDILEDPNFGHIDEFYNFASQSHVGLSFKNPVYTMQASGIAMFYILEALHDLTPRTKVFQACTSEMFGGDPKNCPFNEESKFELRSPYAIAKKIAYDWICYYRQTYDMFACVAYCFNHSNVYRHSSFFIQKICLGATRIILGKAKDLTLGNLEFARDESYSDFCIEAFWKMLQKDTPIDYVIGRDEAFTGTQFLDEAFGHYNLDWRKYVKQSKELFRQNEVIKLVSDSRKAQKELNWRPNRMSFRDHIRIMCEHNYSLELHNNVIYPNVFELYP